jgi:tRNA threonylcarbamoyladenosine biosynthesis protein TsaB
MKILAIEFSSEERGIAVVEGQTVLSHARERGGRRAIELVESALAQAQIEREAIEGIVLGLGPGSYTGIRGAIALACGWQLGRDIKLLGISTVECLARQLKDSGATGPVNLVIDAQRNEYYVARYELGSTQPRLVEELHLVAAADIEKRCGEGQLAYGPEIQARFPQARDLYPDAAILGRMADGRADFQTADRIEPIYLRQTDFKKAPPRRVIS